MALNDPKRALVAMRAVLTSVILFFYSATADAGRGGWYFESFSWRGLETYFGQGTSKQKAKFLKQLDGVVAENRRKQFPALPLSDREIALWRSFIKGGVDYAKLAPEDARIADGIFETVIAGWREAYTGHLRVKGETTPDFIAPHVFQDALDNSGGPARELLQTFEYGRPYGQVQRRTNCTREEFPKTKTWICYVVLSPPECGMLAVELERVLKLPAMADDRKYLQGFQRALARASREARGMYVHISD
jgi:hypothetical protein